MNADEGDLLRRVVRSANALALRGLSQRLSSLLAVLFVARLLAPSDFGTYALVSSVAAVALAVVDCGMLTSLVRAPQAPSRAEVRLAVWIQTGLALALLVVAAGSAAFIGAGVMLLAAASKLPVVPVCLEARVRLQRELRFGTIALADAVTTFTSALFSVGLVLVLRNALALLLADLIASWVGAALLLRRSRAEVEELRSASGVLPAPSWSSMVREGLPFQVYGLASIARELTTVSFVAVVIGLRDLGLLQCAVKVLSPVALVFKSLSQLAVPLGRRLLDRRGHAARDVQSGLLLAGFATAVVLAAISASARWVVPGVFGQRWAPDVPLLAAIALSLVLSGPLMSLGLGLVLAARRGGVATAIVLASAAVFMLTVSATASGGGARAAANSCVVMSSFEAVAVAIACRRLLGVRLLRTALLPAGVFLTSWWAAVQAGRLAHGAAAAALVSLVVAALVGLVTAAPWGLRPALELRNRLRSVSRVGDVARTVPMAPALEVSS